MPHPLAVTLGRKGMSCVQQIFGPWRHKSQVTSHTSHVTRHTSHVTRDTSHVTRHTSHVTRHMSHVTHRTSHVPRHTSNYMRHTPRATRNKTQSAHHVSTKQQQHPFQPNNHLPLRPDAAETMRLLLIPHTATSSATGDDMKRGVGGVGGVGACNLIRCGCRGCRTLLLLTTAARACIQANTARVAFRTRTSTQLLRRRMPHPHRHGSSNTRINWQHNHASTCSIVQPLEHITSHGSAHLRLPLNRPSS